MQMQMYVLSLPFHRLSMFQELIILFVVLHILFVNQSINAFDHT